MISGSDMAEMPKYTCHKCVHALKINAIVEVDGGAELYFLGTYEPIKVDAETKGRFKFVDRFGEPDLGYYVVYDDNHVSWSPTREFEKGYSRI